MKTIMKNRKSRGNILRGDSEEQRLKRDVEGGEKEKNIRRTFDFPATIFKVQTITTEDAPTESRRKYTRMVHDL